VLYRQRITRILDYIRAGDTYQVNLSRVWRLRLRQRVAAIDLYEQLRRANPAPFAGLMTVDADRAVISSSPERLVSARHGRVSTRPIAGTYPRSASAGEDQALAQALVRNPKERAEHVMLVDLERNDLGRICRVGSVHMDESLVVESYRHVHHLVSNISGELNAGVTPAQVIRAVFPGGTITGCPKLRTMQIIAELEGTARGAYTGSMGYINRDGSLDLNILIRTLMQDGKSVQLRAGGGIVADSDPDRELNETRAKAKGMLAALAMAGTAS
jgi:anthranilate synthase component 1